MRLSKLNRLIIAFLVLFAIALGVEAYLGLRWDPRFTLPRLRGMTPQQVTAILGTPDVDPRSPAMGGWTPADQAAGERLTLIYDDRHGWLGQEYTVIFSRNQVVEVKRATK